MEVGMPARGLLMFCPTPLHVGFTTHVLLLLIFLLSRFLHASLCSLILVCFPETPCLTAIVKDVMPKDKSGVVYAIPSSCGYVGETVKKNWDVWDDHEGRVLIENFKKTDLIV